MGTTDILLTSSRWFAPVTPRPIEIAKRLVKDCPIELWRGEHFVIRLMPV